MAATIITSFSYPLSDFTSLGGNTVNKSILAQEIADDATITLSVNSVESVGSTIKIDLEGDATAAMKTALDAIVAAHTGGAFATFPQKQVLEAESSDDSGSPVQKVSLSTGLMPAGTYLLGWYMELATTTDGGGVTAARGHLNMDKNSAGAVERGQSNNGENQWKNFSGSFVDTYKDGDQLDLELTYERVGTSGNAARAQRARLTITRIG